MDDQDRLLGLAHQQVNRLLGDFRRFLAGVGGRARPKCLEGLRELLQRLRARLDKLQDIPDDVWARLASAAPEGMPVAPFGREAASWNEGVVNVALAIDDCLPNDLADLTKDETDQALQFLPGDVRSIDQAEIYTKREHGRARWPVSREVVAEHEVPAGELEEVCKELTPDQEVFLRRLVARPGQWIALGSIHDEFWPNDLYDASRVHDLKRRTVKRLEQHGHGAIAERIENQRDRGYRFHPSR